MPRKPRFYLPGIPAHVIQRGNSRQAVFFSDEDYTAYLDWLKEWAEKHGCAIHAYILMTNQVHLLMTPQTREAISKTIQFVGRHYVTYINHVYGRSNQRGQYEPYYEKLPPKREFFSVTADAITCWLVPESYFRSG